MLVNLLHSRLFEVGCQIFKSSAIHRGGTASDFHRSFFVSTYINDTFISSFVCWR